MATEAMDVDNAKKGDEVEQAAEGLKVVNIDGDGKTEVEWSKVLPLPTGWVEREMSEGFDPENFTAGEMYWYNDKLSESRVLLWPWVISNRLTDNFAWRAKGRVEMPLMKRGAKNFIEFGPQPREEIYADKEATFKEMIKEFRSLEIFLTEKQEKALNDTYDIAPIRGILPAGESHASQPLIDKLLIHKEELIKEGACALVPRTLNVTRWRAFYGFTPFVKDYQPWISSRRDKQGSYDAREVDYADNIVACARMHVDEVYNKPTRSRLPHGLGCINFDTARGMSLFESRFQQLTHERSNDRLPNMWREVTMIDRVTTRYSLSPATFRVLQLLLDMGDLRLINYDEEPPLGKAETWLYTPFNIKEPRLRCLLDSTMTPMVAMQLKTIANMGWLNLELNNDVHFRRYRRQQFDKQLDYIEYTCVQQIMLLNWLYEVLFACQAEFYNYGLIRNTIKFCEGFTSTAIGLATIVEYNMCQEVHAEHSITPPKGRTDNSNFLGLYEGQVQKMSLIQSILIELQKVQWHHAQCYAALHASNVDAFRRQDEYFMNSMFDLNSLCWKAYVAAKEMGSLPDRDMEIQRRFIWLTASIDFDAKNSARRMPVMCWTKKTYEHYAQFPDFDRSQWNEKPGKCWADKPSPRYAEMMKAKKEQKFGTKPEAVLEMSAMNLVPVEDEEALSSGDEFSKNQLANEDAPVDTQTRTWLRTQIAQSHGRALEKHVYERVSLIEAQLGERALADIDIREEEIKEFDKKAKGAKALTNAHIYLNETDHQGLINWVTMYKEQVKKVERKYDRMFDPRWVLSEEFAEYETEIRELARMMSHIRQFFLKENYNKKGSDSLYLTKLCSPVEWIVRTKENKIIHELNWDKWALRRELNGPWMDMKNHTVGEEMVHSLNLRYTILSQNIAFKRRMNSKYELFRRALSIHPDDILRENRGFYEPKSDGEITTCMNCDIDLTVGPHKNTCWWKIPETPKAVMQFRENRAEWNPELVLAKYINDNKGKEEEGIVEYMKLHGLPEKALHNLAKKGNIEARRIIHKTGLTTQFSTFGVSTPVGGRGRPAYPTAGVKRPYMPQGQFSYVRPGLASSSTAPAGQVEVEDENMEHMFDGSQSEAPSEGYRTAMSKRSRQSINRSYRESSSDRGGRGGSKSPWRGPRRGYGASHF
jgi:hypothetical protein